MEANGIRYRMPVVFGPSDGPRQAEHGESFDCSDSPRTIAGFSFLSDRRVLDAVMPPRCELDGEPVVTVEHIQLREVNWLAGRGYNILGVKFPVVFRGEKETARGAFLAVLWENMAEPILTGREELGYAKLYCDLPSPHLNGNNVEYSAAWGGHEFARLSFEDLVDAEPSTSTPVGDGVIHHRYLPSLRVIGAADVDEMVITPSGGYEVKYDRFRRGKGSVEFVRSSWAQMPTMHHIVNRLADWPVLETRDAWVTEIRGAKDLSDQRVLM